MLSDPQKAIDYVLRFEGGLEEDSHDPGGVSKFGISLRFIKTLSYPSLRKYGLPCDLATSEDIINLTLEQAKEIYLGEFWSKAPFEKITNQDVANFIFDASINMGLAPAIKCAQRACWSVMKKKDCILEDGILGDATLAMINHCDLYLLSPLRSERAGDYKLIALRNNEQEFLDGWLSRSYTGV